VLGNGLKMVSLMIWSYYNTARISAPVAPRCSLYVSINMAVIIVCNLRISKLEISPGAEMSLYVQVNVAAFT